MNILKELVKASGLNQVNFAKKVGRSAGHISRGISQGGNMNFSTIFHHAEKCGIKQLVIIEGEKKVTIKF